MSTLKKPKITHESAKSSRVLEITLHGKELSTPTYFPAISSYGIKFSFRDLLYLLKAHRFPRVLISAYDLHHMRDNERRNVLRLIKSYRKKGFVFLDSGLFESSWKRDDSWSVSSYKTILSWAEFDVYSSFDIYKDDKKSHQEFKNETFSSVLESSVFLNDVLFFPILHESSPTLLLKLVEEFVENHPDMCSSIAVAERDIGKGIQERAETIVELRRILNGNDHRNLLHILGCGNPLSMLVYSYCGADTFDSLDWLKFVINTENFSINDFSHLELLNCKCRICTESPYKNTEYLQRALLHNLLFYQNFIMQLQSLIRNNNLKAYLHKYIDESIMDEINEY